MSCKYVFVNFITSSSPTTDTTTNGFKSPPNLLTTNDRMVNNMTTDTISITDEPVVSSMIANRRDSFQSFFTPSSSSELATYQSFTDNLHDDETDGIEYVLPLSPSLNSSPAKQNLNQHKQLEYDRFMGTDQSLFNGTAIIEKFISDSISNSVVTYDELNTCSVDNPIDIIYGGSDEWTYAEDFLLTTIAIAPATKSDATTTIALENLTDNSPKDLLSTENNINEIITIDAQMPDGEAFNSDAERQNETNDNDECRLDGKDDGGNSSEAELTDLEWLIDLKKASNMSAGLTGCANSRSTNGQLAVNTNFNGSCIIDDIDNGDDSTEREISNRDLSAEKFNKFMTQVKQSQKNYAEREQFYKIEPLEKPPFNYAQIIAMAMMDNGRMTLKEICKWIQDRFAYFRYNKNWNNSIRHNLSLHFCFTKIARDKTEKGKGGYWELAMNTAKSEKKRIRNRRKYRDQRIQNLRHHRRHNDKDNLFI